MSSHVLIEDNIALLKSAIELLNSFDDARFAMRQLKGSKSGVGSHMRHVIDHYQCLLSSVEGVEINYDHRERSGDVERLVSRSIQALDQIIVGLDGAKQMDKDRCFRVRMDCGTNHSDDGQMWCESSFGRELQFLVSHTIHHFAIIDLFCQLMGLQVPKDFGVAPSTLKYINNPTFGN